MSEAERLADELDDTPNWQKEKWGSQWKHSTMTYSRVPFEAAAELRRLSAELAALKAAMEEPDGLSDDELSELAHSANQEALSFGLGHDLFLRYFRTLRNRALAPAPPAPQASVVQHEPLVWFDNAGKIRGRVSAEQLEQLCREGIAQLTPESNAQDVPDDVVLQIDAAVTQAQKVLSDWNEWYGMHGEKAPPPPSGIVKAQELLASAKSLLASAPPAPQADKYVPCPHCGKNTASDNPSQWCPCPKQASVVQQEPVAHINSNGVIHAAGYPWNPAEILRPLVYGDTHLTQQAKPQPLTSDQKWDMWTAATIEQPSARGCYFRGVEDAEHAHGITKE